MITKIKNRSFDRRNYPFTVESSHSEMITSRQQRILTDLILTNMFEDDRERMLQQLPEMTSEDATDMMFEIESANWR